MDLHQIPGHFFNTHVFDNCDIKVMILVTEAWCPFKVTYICITHLKNKFEDEKIFLQFLIIDFIEIFSPNLVRIYTSKCVTLLYIFISTTDYINL